MNQTKSTWLMRIIAGLALLVSNLIAGVGLGLLWVKLFIPAKQMGWDGLADVLGGIMVGGLLGIVVTVLAVFLVSIRVQWVWGGIAVVIGGLAFAFLALTAPEREVAAEPIIEEKFRPAFVLRMSATQSQEILAEVPASERPFPFVEAEIWTGKPELNRVDWEVESERCVAKPAHADFATILPLVQEVIDAADPDCRTPEDDLRFRVRWNIENNPGNITLDAGCLPDQPETEALIEAVDTLAERLCMVTAEGNDSN